MNSQSRSDQYAVNLSETSSKTHSPGDMMLGAEIRIALDPATMEEIRQLRKRGYRAVYPSMDLENDVLDEQAITLYSRDINGVVNSTARLSVDGHYPLPEHEYLADYRHANQRLMEWGRFIIEQGDWGLLKSYYRAVFTIASRLGFDVVVMAMQPGHISFHQRLLGLRIIKRHTGVTYGGEHDLACVAWELKQTKPRFFKWIAS